MPNRYVPAMILFAVLAVLAGLTLRDFPNFPLRTAAWVAIGFFAFRTWLHMKRK